MQFALENQQRLIKGYTKEKLSIHELAKEFDTYPNKILRALRFLNVKLRNKTEAIIEALKSGRKPHPTKGLKRSDEVKKSISEKRTEAWKNLTPDEKLDISNRQKQVWKEIPEDKKAEFRKLSVAGIQNAAKHGSALENYLHEGLLKAGYDCHQHRNLLENGKLEVDLYLPRLSIAIEVDGPSHVLPIWGEDVLKSNKRADSEKNGLLMIRGVSVIRLRCLKKNISQKTKRDSLSKVITSITSLESQKQPTTVYVEV